MTKPKNSKKTAVERAPPKAAALSDSNFRKALTTNNNNTTHSGSTSSSTLHSSSSSPSNNDNNNSSSSSSSTRREIREMASDGNCLFRALSDQLNRDWGERHSQVRQDICDYLEAHADDFRHFLLLENDNNDDNDDDNHYRRRRRSKTNNKEEDTDVCEITDYVRKMRQDGEWGGQVELVCAARLYQRKITVFSPAGAYNIDYQLDNHPTQSSPTPTTPTRLKQKQNKNYQTPDSSSSSYYSQQVQQSKKQLPGMTISYHENNHYNSVFILGTGATLEEPQVVDWSRSEEEDDVETSTTTKTHSPSTSSHRKQHSVIHDEEEHVVEVVLASSPPKSLKSKAMSPDSPIIPPTATIHRPAAKAMTRNAACPCGSGLRFKKCCMDKEKLKRNKHLTVVRPNRQGYTSMAVEEEEEHVESKNNQNRDSSSLEMLEGGFRIIHI